MDKKLKETIKIAKRLQRKELLYMTDGLELEAEINYQAIALIVEDINILMKKEQYEFIKNDKENLVYEMALSTFNDEDLLSDTEVEFMENLIEEYIDVDDPVLIDGMYCFATRMDRLQKIYEKALVQIKKKVNLKI